MAAPPPPPPIPINKSPQLKPETPKGPKLVKPKQVDIPESIFLNGTEAAEGRKLRFVVVSDTHNYIDRMEIPPGDIFIHAGDFTVDGTREEVERFAQFMAPLPHRFKIVVAGNHERTTKYLKPLLQPIGVIVLEDEATTVEGIKIYGTKWNFSAGRLLSQTGVDILLCHQPPVGHSDIIYTGESVGSRTLAQAAEALRPKLVISGHNHEGYSITQDEHTVYLNAACCIGGASSSMRRGAMVFDCLVPQCK